MRTAGNAVFIYSIVSLFYGELCLQGDKSLLKSNFFKEGLVDFNGIKGGISKKSLRFNKRMFLEEMMRKSGKRKVFYIIRNRWISFRQKKIISTDFLLFFDVIVYW